MSVTRSRYASPNTTCSSKPSALACTSSTPSGSRSGNRLARRRSPGIGEGGGRQGPPTEARAAAGQVLRVLQGERRLERTRGGIGGVEQRPPAAIRGDHAREHAFRPGIVGKHLKRDEIPARIEDESLNRRRIVRPDRITTLPGLALSRNRTGRQQRGNDNAQPQQPVASWSTPLS